MSNELEIRTYPGRPIGPGDDIVVSQEELDAYILAEVLKAKPEKRDTGGSMQTATMYGIENSAYNQALDDYKQALIVRFGPQQGASTASSEVTK